MAPHHLLLTGTCQQGLHGVPPRCRCRTGYGLLLQWLPGDHKQINAGLQQGRGGAGREIQQALPPTTDLLSQGTALPLLLLLQTTGHPRCRPLLLLLHQANPLSMRRNQRASPPAAEAAHVHHREAVYRKAVRRHRRHRGRGRSRR